MALRFKIPQSSRFIPIRAERQRLFEAIRNRNKEDFHSYWDWFFYIHICPISRFIHWVGMLLGLYFYTQFFFEIGKVSWWISLSDLIIGIICFYYFGVISHLIYDNIAGKVVPKYWYITFWAVIYINLITMFGLYGRELKKQIKKYPFINDDWQLVDKTPCEAFLHFLRR